MKLTLSPTQARVIVDALDHYSRMGMGQLWTIAELLTQLRPDECTDRYDMEARFIEPLQMEYFQRPLNAADSICSAKVPNVSKIAYDLLCVIRRRLPEVESHLPGSVWRGEPLHTCRSEPLARID